MARQSMKDCVLRLDLGFLFNVEPEFLSSETEYKWKNFDVQIWIVHWNERQMLML